MSILKNTDVLVDSPFIQDLCTMDIRWRGSSNQRIIDVPETLSSGAVTLIEE